MLDPVSALAFEMQAAKGVFALLLGSGISRAAKIPTGWEITLDLVRRAAAAEGEDAGPDPAAWYHARFGKTPDYSDLLDKLATSPALRQEVIRAYIEPSPEERERGDKMPTAAHKAIAQLMVDGFVRVVLTTNFDRLLEQALSDLGTTAAVISSADHLAGAVPLIHGGPVIIKLHGDYHDTRIRNTVAELTAYEPALDQALDGVLDDFGLIVCGWSAEWDIALKAAIDRAPSRRYPMVWAARGAPGSAAQALIARRSGRVAQIEGADAFFEALAEKIRAIQLIRQPHPLSSELAVAMMKDYLPDPRQQIRLHDFVHTEFRRLIERIDAQQFSKDVWSEIIFADQVARYSAATEPVLPMAYAAGLWSTPNQADQWIDFVAHLAERRQGSGQVPLIDLQCLPATLILYAFSLGAVSGKRPELAGRMVGKVASFGYRGDTFALGDQLNVATVITIGGGEHFKILPAYRGHARPASNWIADVLRPLTKHELLSPLAFESAFARLELGLSLGYVERVTGEDRFWAPPARVAADGTLRASILKSWRADVAARHDQSEPRLIGALSKPPRLDELENHLKALEHL